MAQTLVSAVDARFRGLFAFTSFNSIQSKCFDAVYQGDDNFVLSAPTSSGKTTICELAICRLLSTSPKRSFKVVYQAPTKSLCDERQRDWSRRFSALGLRTALLTGDTNVSQLGSLEHTDIIITTPEKWDSITRKWNQHRRLLSAIKLFLIDEVHTLKDDRGAVLEAVVARVKSMTDGIRFIALSATILNVNDVCLWLGRNSRLPHLAAHSHSADSQLRPVPLALHVHGYPCNTNNFAFEKALSGQLPALLRKYSRGDPIIVFCTTRAACVETARYLQQWFQSTSCDQRIWDGSASVPALDDEDLREVLKAGVAFHHGGLSSRDRADVEKLFKSKTIGVLCCTSTLATGVNLPCHLVVVKGTVCLSTNLREYTELELMQMLGRAGRPQYHTAAIAVIMTKQERVEQYEVLGSGSEHIESRLHLNLIDHMNAEVALGNVHDLHSAERWIQRTYLFVRLKQNPGCYGLNEESDMSLEQHVKQICANGLDLLIGHSLATSEQDIRSTSSGVAMSRYYIQFDTMKLISQLDKDAGVEDVLRVLSQAAEFRDIYMRAGERQTLNVLDSLGSIRYPLGVHHDAAWQKVYTLLQWQLSGTPEVSGPVAPQQGFHGALRLVDRQVHRLLRCLVDCLVGQKHSQLLLHALYLSRSLSAGAWDDSTLTMSQLDGIGSVSVRKLIQGNIRCIEDIATAEPRALERLLSRNPPYGNDLYKKAQQFPQLFLVARCAGEPIISDARVSVKLEVEVGFLNLAPPQAFNGRAITVQAVIETACGILLQYARISARKIDALYKYTCLADLPLNTSSINAHVMCEDIAGTLRNVTISLPHIEWRSPKQSGEEGHAIGSNSTRVSSLAELHGDDDWDLDIGASAAKDTAPEFMDVDQILEAQSPADQMIRLPNGKFACNHKCKRKTECKHLCCREGLDKPPKPPKAPQEERKLVATTSQKKQLRQTSIADHISAVSPALNSTLDARRAGDQLPGREQECWTRTTASEDEEACKFNDSDESSSSDLAISSDLQHDLAVNSTFPRQGPIPLQDVDMLAADWDDDTPDLSGLSTNRVDVMHDAYLAGKSKAKSTPAEEHLKETSASKLPFDAARAFLGEEFFHYIDAQH